MMTTTAAPDCTAEPWLRALHEYQGPGARALQWDASRLALLHRIAAAQDRSGFETNCTRGQIAAAEGNWDTAKAALGNTLEAHRTLFPDNGHFFSHIVQLALAMQAFPVIASFLDARHDTPDLFRVAFDDRAPHPGTNLVEVDDAGHCRFGLNPQMPGAAHADHFVNHWLGSVPLFASFCRGQDRAIGRTLMNIGDAATHPGLAYCGNTSESLLVPDNYFIDSRGYRETKERLRGLGPGWDCRASIAFWRGATTGLRTGAKDWRSLPRVRLCLIAREHHDLIDAGLSKVVQAWAETDAPEIEAAGLMRGPVPFEHFANYKYQIDIDGNSNSWPGLFQKLLTGSPVLKVASPHGYRQWYYDRLRPWINFVPVEVRHGGPPGKSAVAAHA